MNGYHTEFRPGTNWEPPRFQPGAAPLTPNPATLGGRQQTPLFESATIPLFGNFDSPKWNPGNVETPDANFALNRTFLPPVVDHSVKWNNNQQHQTNNMLLGHTTSQNPLGVSDFNIHDTQIPVDQSLIWRNPNPKRMAPPDKGTSLWGDPDHHATIEIKRWKTYGDDVVDARSQLAVAAAAGSTFFNAQQQSSNLTTQNPTKNTDNNNSHFQNDNQTNNDIDNFCGSDQLAKDSKDQNGCDDRYTITDENSTIENCDKGKNFDSTTNNNAVLFDSSSKSETSSLRDVETSSSTGLSGVLDDVNKLRWGPVVTNSNDGSPWSSAPQTEDTHATSTNAGGSSSLDNTSTDSVFSTMNANSSNEISSSLINSIKDQNAHLNFAPSQKLITGGGNLAPKDVEEKAEEYKLRLLSLVNRGYVELNSLGRLYEQENTVILLNNMMQICQQLDDMCQRREQLQNVPQQKVLFDRLTNLEIPRLQTALQTLKEQIYAVCNNNNNNNINDSNASPRKSSSLWNSDTIDQQQSSMVRSSSFFTSGQPNTWSNDHQQQQQNLQVSSSSSSTWSTSSPMKQQKPGSNFMNFTTPQSAVMNENNFDSAFGGLSLSDQNNRFTNGYQCSEFRPGTKWEPPRQPTGLPPLSTRPQSMFKANAAPNFGAFVDPSRKMMTPGLDGPFLGGGGIGGRPPWTATTAPPPPAVFRTGPPPQAQPIASQQLPWFVLSKVNKNVNEAHLKMFLNNFGRIQAFYYWQTPGLALFQFADMPSPETAQLLQQRLYSQGITLTLHKQAEAEKIAEAMSGRATAAATSFQGGVAAQSSFFDNSMLYNKFP